MLNICNLKFCVQRTDVLIAYLCSIYIVSLYNISCIFLVDWNSVAISNMLKYFLLLIIFFYFPYK